MQDDAERRKDPASLTPVLPVPQTSPFFSLALGPHLVCVRGRSWLCPEVASWCLDDPMVLGLKPRTAVCKVHAQQSELSLWCLLSDIHFWQCWGSNPGPYVCEANALLLSPMTWPETPTPAPNLVELVTALFLHFMGIGCSLALLSATPPPARKSRGYSFC